MVILYYFTLIAPFMTLFAMGYLPVAWFGRMFMKRRIVEADDAWAALAGTVGTVVGFLFFGLTNLDRFALAPDHVRTECRLRALRSSTNCCSPCSAEP